MGLFALRKSFETQKCGNCILLQLLPSARWLPLSLANLFINRAEGFAVSALPRLAEIGHKSRLQTSVLSTTTIS